jgi:putative endonuclease
MKRGWEVYILQTESGKLYTGITTDFERRLKEHQTGKGAKFFHLSPVIHVVFRESHPNRSSASQREAAIKKMSKKEKKVLILTRGDFPLQSSASTCID